jgi:hypothetical protein
VYCPNCGAEYRPGFTVCTDCHVALVPDAPEGIDYEGLTPEEKSDKPRFDPGRFERLEPECVYVVTAPPLAQLVLSAFRAHGIKAFAAGSGVEQWEEAGNVGQIARAPGPFNSTRIMVHPDDWEDARALVLHAEQQDVEDEDDDYISTRPAWRVDRRSHRRVRRIFAFTWLLFLSPTALGIGLWPILLVESLLQ